MFAVFLNLALQMVAGTPAATEPPPALRRLYDKPVRQDDAGEPYVTVGLVADTPEVTLVAHGALTATWTSPAGTHTRSLPDGAVLQAKLVDGEAAPARYVVPLEAPMWLETACAPHAVGCVVEQLGSFWPMFHPPQDLRRSRRVLMAEHLRAAKLLAKTQARASGVYRAPERVNGGYPKARLMVHAEHAATSLPLGEATSIITVQGAPDSCVEVRAVPFGMGYPWAGVANRRYRGDVLIAPNPNGRLAVVNALPIEQMLWGVVPAEVPAQAPKEALAAQAVAARSNIVWSLGLRHSHEPYHFCAEQHCQVYGGLTQEDARTTQAIDATRGGVAVRGGHVVNALYSASCGGHTENNDIAWQQEPDGALRGVSDQLTPQARGGRDTDLSETERLAHHIGSTDPSYCTAATLAHPGHGRWQKVLGEPQLQALWGPWAQALGPLTDVVTGPRGPGGRLTTLTLVGTRGSHVLRHELPIRKALGGLHSAAMVLAVEHDAHHRVRRLIVQGVGWGHGVGLCQMGALGRAEAGASHQEILGHYYGGAQVQHFWSTFAP